jgi:hypothetical protein
VIRNTSSSLRGLVLAVVAIAAAAPALRADWLVLRDGSKLELRGAWKVDGKRVVFQLADGTLSSLKLDQVDLDASAKATANAAAPAPPKKSARSAPAEPKARRVFTDADFSHPVLPDPEAAVADGAAEGATPNDAQPKADTKAAQPLEVLVWNQSVDPGTGQITITGTLRNAGEDLATAVVVEVQLVDRNGAVLTKSNANVSTPNVRAGAEVEFRVRFPSTPGFETAKFDIKSVLFKAAPKTEAAPKT